MSRFHKLLLVVVACAPLSFATTPQTYLSLNSQPGDYIGGGQQQTFTPADGTFTVQTTFNNGIVVGFHTANFSSTWNMYFGPRTGQTFVHGIYESAERFAFHSPTRPGIDVSGDGRGCNTDAGRFLVSELTFASDGSVASFAIDFEQHCEGAAPALYGSVRYNSSVSASPRISVASADVLKGNAGTHGGNAIVSLSIPSTQLVTVHFATADDTAKQGVDYLATTGNVQFPAGTTAQTITIPIVGNLIASGNKFFKLKLSAPVNASLGPSGARVKIFDPNIAMTALAMSSQPGDFIGQGLNYLFTTADGVFTPSINFDSGVSVALHSSASWQLDFAAPDKANLSVGTYDNAQRFPFQAPGIPGLSVSGNGGGCNTLTGNFVVNRLLIGTSGAVSQFSADLEQHCEGGIPALFASVRIQSSLRQISISDAVIDQAASTATFTVTLHPSKKTPVSVNFATANSTAIAGVDYIATSQTANFPPGQTQQTVTVPLILVPDGGKVFFGELSAPAGSALWIRQGSATF